MLQFIVVCKCRLLASKYTKWLSIVIKMHIQIFDACTLMFFFCQNYINLAKWKANVFSVDMSPSWVAFVVIRTPGYCLATDALSQVRKQISPKDKSHLLWFLHLHTPLFFYEGLKFLRCNSHWYLEIKTCICYTWLKNSRSMDCLKIEQPMMLKNNVTFLFFSQNYKW